MILVNNFKIILLGLICAAGVSPSTPPFERPKELQCMGGANPDTPCAKDQVCRINEAGEANGCHAIEEPDCVDGYFKCTETFCCCSDEEVNCNDPKSVSERAKYNGCTHKVFQEALKDDLCKHDDLTGRDAIVVSGSPGLFESYYYGGFPVVVTLVSTSMYFGLIWPLKSVF